MGETISTLVFRPPPPTYIRPDRFFFIDVPVSEDESFSCMGCGGFEPVPSVRVKERSKSPNSTLYPPTSNHITDIPNHGFRIPAIYIRRKGASITLLYSHGNAEDLGMMYNRMKELARILCVNIFAYDYTGYGLSRCVSGSDSHSSETNTIQPSETMCYRNIEAAYNYLRYDRNIPASHIVLYGRSLGSGPSCYLARKTALEGESVGGLILHSPFLSIYSIVLDLGFPIAGDMFRNDAKAKDIRCPVFVIHGTQDDLIPFWHADKLLQCFPPMYQARPFWVEGLGHNNIEIYVKKDFIARVTAFLQNYVPASQSNFDEPLGSEDEMDYIPTVSIPEKERYDPLSMEYPKCVKKYRTTSFFVNQNWMVNGAAIVKMAVHDKNSNNKTSERVPLESLRKAEEFLEFQVDQEKSAASRFVLTRDKIFVDTNDSDDENDGGKVNAFSNNRASTITGQRRALV